MVEYIPCYGGRAEHWGPLPATRLASRKILIEQNIKKPTEPALCVLCGQIFVSVPVEKRWKSVAQVGKFFLSLIQKSHFKQPGISDTLLMLLYFQDKYEPHSDCKLSCAFILKYTVSV
jgi:hypothetical protein